MKVSILWEHVVQTWLSLLHVGDISNHSCVYNEYYIGRGTWGKLTNGAMGQVD